MAYEATDRETMRPIGLAELAVRWMLRTEAIFYRYQHTFQRERSLKTVAPANDLR